MTENSPYRFDPSQRYVATSVDEFIALVNDAIFETEEYIVCVQEELDDELEDLVTPLTQIKTYLKHLEAQLKKGEHIFANGKDLDYVPLVRKLKHVIPFYDLLEGVNTSHHRLK